MCMFKFSVSIKIINNNELKLRHIKNKQSDAFSSDTKFSSLKILQSILDKIFQSGHYP